MEHRAGARPYRLGDRIKAEIGKAIIGHAMTIELMAVALFAGGHLLLEGAPGTSKAFLAQCFARTLGLGFGRIQFTPDLMPSDIVGSNIFNFQTSQFTLTPGPIFCELLLADEINRTPPKTQAALLEAMQERQITIDGRRNALSARFMVAATRNPLEQQGTYPLPESQLDRFLFKQVLDYPTEAEERRIVATYGSRTATVDPAEMGVTTIAARDAIDASVAAVAGVRISVGAPVHADQPDAWQNRLDEAGDFTLRRMFRATDAQGHLMRIYRSDAAGNGAYILGVVIETAAQPPEQTPARVRDAWARGIFAINLSGFPRSN